MLRAYFGSLAALVAWTMFDRYGVAWGSAAFVCEFAALALLSAVSKRSIR